MVVMRYSITGAIIFFRFAYLLRRSQSNSNVDLAAEYGTLLLNNRIGCAVAALVAYEHLITLKYEIDFLWRRKWGAATWIFLSNRYLLLASALYSIAPSGPRMYVAPDIGFSILKLSLSCSNAAMNLLSFVMYTTILDLPLYVFTILRSLALLQNKSEKLLVVWILVALALGLAVCNAYQTFTQTWSYIADSMFGSSCSGTGFSVPFVVIARSALFVAVFSMGITATVLGITSAAIMIIITWITTARQVIGASSLGLKTTLSEILLRDGSTFFLWVLTEDIITLIASSEEPAIFSGPVPTVILHLLDILPHILLSRFIINLRQADSLAASSSDDQHLSRFSIPNFRMPTLDDVVGNLGESLEFVEYDIEDDEDSERDTSTQADEMDSGSGQQDVENAFESMLAHDDVTGRSLSGSGSPASTLDGHSVHCELRLNATLSP